MADDGWWWDGVDATNIKWRLVRETMLAMLGRRQAASGARPTGGTSVRESKEV